MHPSRIFLRRAATTVLAVCVIASQGIQSRDQGERQREQWQRVDDILRAMDVRPGAVVADVGAGDGFFTTRLSAAVGPTGRVLAVDVDESQLERLRRRLGQEHPNVTVVKGTPADPHLPEGTLDAALIVNAYHEMAEYGAMLGAIRRALKPAGRLVIVEPIADARRDAARREQVRQHEIAPDLVMREVRAAGFRVIGLEDPFTTRGRDTEWLLTATPGQATTTTATAAAPEAAPDIEEDWRDPGLRMGAAEVEKLAGSGAATLIDVRDEGMFAKGHIPGAVLIPLGEIETSADRLRGLKRPFVTYCS